MDGWDGEGTIGLFCMTWVESMVFLIFGGRNLIWAEEEKNNKKRKIREMA
jgi:hypothetical protein